MLEAEVWKMLEWKWFIVHQLFVHFRISSSLSFQRKTKRHVFLLLFVLTPVHLKWPSYAIGECYRSPRQLISTMKHWWLCITIHSLTMFKWQMRNLRLNLIYLSFFVQYSFLTVFFCPRVTFSPFNCCYVSISLPTKLAEIILYLLIVNVNELLDT